MKLHLKYICASFLILVSGMMSAQEKESATLEFTYSIDLSEEARISGNASVTYQDTAYMMSGNGIESYCDGSTVWTLDMEAGEVYIESVTDDLKEYMKTLAASLEGIEADSDASFLSPDGQIVKIHVISVKKSGVKDISSFRPTMDIDSSWVVTDLR